MGQDKAQGETVKGIQGFRTKIFESSLENKGMFFVLIISVSLE